MDIEQIQAVPTPFEQDVFRAVQTMPSVAAASDYSSALYVRGGTPDQSLVLLDGMPLLNPYHVGGLFAAVDPDIIQSVDVSMGAMSAAFGDRLASAVSMRSRDPAVRTRGWGSVGLLSTRAGLSGPLGDGGYTVAARTTYIDRATKAAAALGLLEEGLPYGFTDGFAQRRA